MYIFNLHFFHHQWFQLVLIFQFSMLRKKKKKDPFFLVVVILSEVIAFLSFIFFRLKHLRLKKNEAKKHFVLRTPIYFYGVRVLGASIT